MKGSGLAMCLPAMSSPRTSRPLRIEFPGAIYHVTSRGDRREPIFADDADCDATDGGGGAGDGLT